MNDDSLQINEDGPRFPAHAGGNRPPPDYKRTEVGVIPKDWKVAALGETCAFENGDRGAGYPSAGSFAYQGIPFINAGHVAEGRIDMREMDYITQEAFDRLGSGKVKSGDILFCLRGSLGKFGVVGPDFGPGGISSSLVIVRPRDVQSHGVMVRVSMEAF
jgi:type I restriction enzyme S subunit